MSYEDSFPFHQSQVLTSDKNRVYDTRDVLYADSFPRLSVALKTHIHSLGVEFLNTNNGYKPHVVFMLVFKETILENRIAAARLSMEAPLGDGLGCCRIKLLPYSVRTARATGFAFDFKRNPSSTRGRRFQPTLLEFVHAVTGQHPGLMPPFSGGDLTAFNFVEVEGQPLGRDMNLWDGCRDWIAQAFVRFYYLGWVEWQIGGILGPASSPGAAGIHYETFTRKYENEPQINWGSAGFHDVIGLYFTPTAATIGSSSSSRRGSGRDTEVPSVYYNALPMEEGTFLHPAATDSRLYSVLGADGSQIYLPYATGQ